MADLQVRERIQQEAGTSQPINPTDRVISQAFTVMDAVPEPRSKADIIMALSKIKKLLQGVKIERAARRGVDGAIIIFALDALSSSEEARTLLQDIMAEMKPTHRHGGPVRDTEGKIIRRYPPLPPLTEEQLEQFVEYEVGVEE